MSQLNRKEKMELVSYTFLLFFILFPCYPLPKIIVLLFLLISVEVHVKEIPVVKMCLDMDIIKGGKRPLL